MELEEDMDESTNVTLALEDMDESTDVALAKKLKVDNPRVMRSSGRPTKLVNYTETR